MNLKSIFLAAGLSLALMSCDEDKKLPASDATSLTDSRDGQKYKIVKIGEQIWMAENLNYNVPGSTCFFDNSYCPKYGRLYNWKTALKVCPSGWHLPSDGEWQILMNFAGANGEGTARTLKASSGWYDNRNGTDAFGFSALPGGQVGFYGGSFNSNIYGYWWSSSEYNANNAYNWSIFYASDVAYGDKSDKSDFLSVRCLKGYQEPPEEYTEAEKVAIKALNEVVLRIKRDDYTDKRDNKTYRTIKLDNQTWMAENLNYNEKGSKCYENKENNCQIYGRLYNWGTAMKSCPKGWHLPSNAEWQTLVNLADVERSGKILKASSYWIQTGSGTDDFGFSALPGGFRYPTGLFSDIGLGGGWWSSSKIAANKSNLWNMSYSWSSVSKSEDKHTYLHSVRCLQNTK